MWLLWTLACQGDVEPGALYQGSRLPVVDMHLHSGEWADIPPETQGTIAGNFPFPFGLDAAGTAEGTLSTAGIVEQLDKGGISRGVLFAVYAPRTVGISENSLIAAQVSEAPDRLWGLASLPIEAWDETEAASLAILEEGLQSDGMIGVKMAHTHTHQRMDDPRYYSIYALAAAYDAPLYLHTGPTPFPGGQPDPAYTSPRYLEEAIQLHPDADFILGHACYDFLEEDTDDLGECIDLAQRYPNVYIEISALGSRAEGYDVVLSALREAGLVDRILYGSDGPQGPGFVAGYLEATLTVMDAEGYTPEEAAAVLSGNFTRLFDLPEVAL